MSPDEAKGIAAILRTLTMPGVLPAFLWMLGAFIVCVTAVGGGSFFLASRWNKVVTWPDLQKAIAASAATISKENAVVHERMSENYHRAQADCVSRLADHTEETAGHLQRQAGDIAHLKDVSDRTEKRIGQIQTAMVLSDPTGRLKDVFKEIS